jgi:hypothetical protein
MPVHRDPGLLQAQWEAQARAHPIAAARPLRDKVAALLEMQRRLLPILRKRRPLQSWERPWEIEP